MTFTQEEEPADHIRFIAEYEDGSKHFFAVPQCTLEQGLPDEGGTASPVFLLTNGSRTGT